MVFASYVHAMEPDVPPPPVEEEVPLLGQEGTPAAGREASVEFGYENQVAAGQSRAITAFAAAISVSVTDGPTHVFSPPPLLCHSISRQPDPGALPYVPPPVVPPPFGP